MKRIGIAVQLPYANTRVLDFTYELFDKNTMLEYVNATKMIIKKEYKQYTIDTLNCFLAIVASSKTEVFQTIKMIVSSSLLNVVRKTCVSRV